LRRPDHQSLRGITFDALKKGGVDAAPPRSRSSRYGGIIRALRELSNELPVIHESAKRHGGRWYALPAIERFTPLILR